MTYLRAAFLYLISLLRVSLLLILGLIVILLLTRLAARITTAEIKAQGVTGPEIFHWRDDAPDFGGLSALILDDVGTRLLAGTDRGHYVETTLTRDADHTITGAAKARITPVLLRSGTPPTDFKMDLEALSPLPDGRIAQAFEGFVRIETLDTPQATPQATHPWDRFAWAFGNAAFEALATLPDGRLIAIVERPRAQSVIYTEGRWQEGPDLPLSHGYRITGADIGPDGCLYLLERRFSVITGFAFRLRRLSGGPVTGWQDSLIYHSPSARYGNAEGVFVWGEGDQLTASIVTDNGFLPFDPTRLIELRLPKGQCQLTL